MDTCAENANPPCDCHHGSAPSQLLLTAEQAPTSLAICRTKVYELLRNGELESVRHGGSRRISAAALAEYVHRLRDSSNMPLDNRNQHPTVPRHLQGR
jgi:excisionase family DNA binding protein